MRDAMANADVGDDVYGEDPTVNALEALAAQRIGFAASLFVPSGTMSNLLALLTHCGRGDEYIAGQQAHTYKYRRWWRRRVRRHSTTTASISSPMERIDLDAVEAAIKPDDFHFAKTRLAVPREHAGRYAAAARLRAARARVVRPTQTRAASRRRARLQRCDRTTCRRSRS